MDTAAVSGPGRQLAAIIEPLARHGVQLRPVLIRRDSWTSHPYQEFLDALGIEYDVLTDSGPADFRLLGQFRSLVARRQPHVVQTHAYRPTLMAFLAGMPGRSWRWIGFHHGRTSESRKVRLYHMLDVATLPSADQVVVIAESQRAQFRNRDEVLVLPNAVLPGAGPATGSAEWPAVDALPHPRLGVVGRLSPEKGVDVFLRAYHLLRQSGTRCSAVIAGGGQEMNSLKALAAELQLEDLVFLGHLADVAALYPKLDLLVLPSRSEGLPNALLEALNAGKRAVATRVGAVAEVLDSPAAGRVVTPEDPAALAEAIGVMLATPESAESAAARDRILDRYGLARRVTAHIDLYQRVLG
jgi:glycosyltransferase involved in cell wall biosynthesis